MYETDIKFILEEISKNKNKYRSLRVQEDLEEICREVMAETGFTMIEVSKAILSQFRVLSEVIKSSPTLCNDIDDYPKVRIQHIGIFYPCKGSSTKIRKYAKTIKVCSQ